MISVHSKIGIETSNKTNAILKINKIKIFEIYCCSPLHLVKFLKQSSNVVRVERRGNHDIEALKINLQIETNNCNSRRC